MLKGAIKIGCVVRRSAEATLVDQTVYPRVESVQRTSYGMPHAAKEAATIQRFGHHEHGTRAVVAVPCKISN
jgi:hypothetical protein